MFERKKKWIQQNHQNSLPNVKQIVRVKTKNHTLLTRRVSLATKMTPRWHRLIAARRSAHRSAAPIMLSDEYNVGSALATAARTCLYALGTGAGSQSSEKPRAISTIALSHSISSLLRPSHYYRMATHRGFALFFILCAVRLLFCWPVTCGRNSNISARIFSFRVFLRFPM